jgi:hypothetical protein
MRARVFIGAALAAITLSSFAAAGPAEVERARTFFNAGAQAYSAARYRDAVNSFEQAYALAPRPNVLFSLAQSERKEFYASNDVTMLRRALAHYKQYLQEVPSGGRRSEATEAKADLEARASRLDPQGEPSAPAAPAEKKKARLTVVSGTPGAQVTVDNGTPSEVPYFGDVEPGRHSVRVFADGYFDETREVSGDKPVDIPLDVPLRDRPALVTVELDRSGELFVDGRVVATTPLRDPVEVPPGPHIVSVAVNGRKAFSQEVTLQRGKPFNVKPHLEVSGQRTLAWAMIVGGGAGLLVGGLGALVAVRQENKAQDIDSQRQTGNIDAASLEAHNDAITRRDGWRTASIVGASLGGALLAGGVALYLFDRPTVAVVPPRSVEPTPQPKKPDALDIATAPILGPGALGWGVTGRF